MNSKMNILWTEEIVVIKCIIPNKNKSEGDGCLVGVVVFDSEEGMRSEEVF